jgi:cytoskeleton protein RodZ
VSLFQRIKIPFDGAAEDIPVEPGSRVLAVGVLLRERRETLGLNLDAIGEALRIKPVYLAAIEQGRAQDLPGATYAIGFIRAYAQFLGLDGERILESYKAESAEIQARPDLSLPVPLIARSVPGGPILLAGVILALCGYGIWYYLSTGERTRPERVAAVPAELQRVARGTATPSLDGAPLVPSRPAPGSSPGSSSASASPGPRFGSGLLASPDFAPALAAPDPGSPGLVSPSPGPGSPSPGLVASPAAAALPAPPAPVPPASGDTAREMPPARLDATAAPSGDAGAKGDDAGLNPGGRVEIRAVADCWIQVRSADDQSIVFSRVLKAGETYHVPRAGLFLRTGNAGALAIVVEGKPAPAIGGIGTLRRNVALDPEALLAGTAVHG